MDQSPVPPPSPASSQELFGFTDTEVVTATATIDEVDECGWKVVEAVVAEVLEEDEDPQDGRISRMNWSMDQEAIEALLQKHGLTGKRLALQDGGLVP